MKQETKSQMLNRLIKEHERLERQGRLIKIRTAKLIKKTIDLRGLDLRPLHRPPFDA